MKKIMQKSIGVLLGVVVLFYVTLLVLNMGNNVPMETQDLDAAELSTIAIFGATGTIGDGLLKAAMNDPVVNRVFVVTRRPSKRIEEGVASGKVTMTIHKDFLNYSAIREILAEVDAVYWAIGLSAVGLDEETYREIHVTYPLKLVGEWMRVRTDENISFHYISGGGTKADSRMMWAREKARAENELSDMARDSNLRVISYRPAFVTPTEMEANIGHKVAHAILAPVDAAVTAESIGQAMLEISARGQQFQNGTILENKDIVGFSEAYKQRHSDEHSEE